MHSERHGRHAHRDFTVEMLDDVGLVYREGERTMLVRSAELSGALRPVVNIRLRDLREWQAPFDNVAVTQEDRLRVMRNIERYFRRGMVKARVFWEEGD
jgi:hypothetical protein